jgi:hypothetical protein
MLSLVGLSENSGRRFTSRETYWNAQALRRLFSNTLFQSKLPILFTDRLLDNIAGQTELSS